MIIFKLNEEQKLYYVLYFLRQIKISRRFPLNLTLTLLLTVISFLPSQQYFTQFLQLFSLRQLMIRLASLQDLLGNLCYVFKDALIHDCQLIVRKKKC